MTTIAPGETGHSGAITVPPVIFGLAFALGLALEAAWPIAAVPSGIRYPVGLALMAASAVIVGFVAREFLRHRTTIHVHRATTALITRGPFRYSRNPAYVALVLLYVGLAVVLDSIWVLAMLVPALTVLHHGVIVREERYLERLFGEEYRRYRARVRRWI